MTGLTHAADRSTTVKNPTTPGRAASPPAALTRWFAASTQRRRVLIGTTATYEPWGLVHAREIGALTSLCGRSGISWHMFFDRRFSSIEPTSCPDCSAAARAMDAGRARRS
jgi:hypothetical protein